MNVVFLEFYEKLPELKNQEYLKIAFDMFYTYNLDGEKMSSWKVYGIPEDGRQFYETIQDFKAKLSYSIIKRV